MSEQLWARQLAKQKFQNRIPLATQEKNLKEKMAYEKNLLWQATQKKDEPAIKKHFQTLVKLRTRLLLLNLQKRKENFQLVNDRIIKEEAHTLARETTKLAQALNISFD